MKHKKWGMSNHLVQKLQEHHFATKASASYFPGLRTFLLLSASLPETSKITTCFCSPKKNTLKPSTLGVKPSTLGVKPSTLGVKPSTLGVKPFLQWKGETQRLSFNVGFLLDQVFILRGKKPWRINKYKLVQNFDWTFIKLRNEGDVISVSSHIKSYPNFAVLHVLSNVCLLFCGMLFCTRNKAALISKTARFKAPRPMSKSFVGDSFRTRGVFDDNATQCRICFVNRVSVRRAKSSASCTHFDLSSSGNTWVFG